MTRDDIIRMARECDIIDFRDESDDPHAKQMVDFLDAFANLVASAEREACDERQKQLEKVIKTLLDALEVYGPEYMHGMSKKQYGRMVDKVISFKRK